ncbi:uncharacterized protein METZ01_LOCUS490148, partial [marine metagenome]
MNSLYYRATVANNCLNPERNTVVTASKTFTEEFLENGFVIAEGVLDPETVLEPIIHE